MRLNWKVFRLGLVAVAILLLNAGCSGINASKSISPLDFLLPGVGGFLESKPLPPPVEPTLPAPVPAIEIAQIQ